MTCPVLHVPDGAMFVGMCHSSLRRGGGGSGGGGGLIDVPVPYHLPDVSTGYHTALGERGGGRVVEEWEEGREGGNKKDRRGGNSEGRRDWGKEGWCTLSVSARKPDGYSLSAPVVKCTQNLGIFVKSCRPAVHHSHTRLSRLPSAQV